MQVRLVKQIDEDHGPSFGHSKVLVSGLVALS